MKIINLTPHDVNIVEEDGTLVKIFESEGLARVSTVIASAGEINGIPVTTTEFGEVEGLPDTEEGIMYIVSRMVIDALDRNDLLAPNELIRDGKGNIVGAKSLSR